MTSLYLSLNDGQTWQQVFFAGNGGFKLTRENPYFMQSESYTFDVTLPMTILENKTFFSNIQRIDTSKKNIPMKCRLTIDNRPVLSGSARITSVTESAVKVQLLGGRSEVNFLGDEEYIDEVPLGTHSGVTVVWPEDLVMDVSAVQDETRGGGRNAIYQFGLVFLAKQIVKHYGFSVEECSVDVEPWNRLFVATAKNTEEASHTLPHWTPREFFTEFCNFFNLVIVTDEVARTVKFLSAPQFFNTTACVSIEPAEEYTTEVDEDSDAHALASDDLSYDLSSSSGHDYDCLQDNVREYAPSTDYATYDALNNAYNDMSDAEKQARILRCPVGSFTGWVHDYSQLGLPEELLMKTQIDVFAPLRREGSTGETKLKICPVAMDWWNTSVTFGTGDAAHTINQTSIAPALENPTGNDTPDDGATIQDYVLGEAEVDVTGKKEDRLQVMFIDDVVQKAVRNDSLTPESYSQFDIRIGFTDWRLKSNPLADSHRNWSLSLNSTDADYYLGQLHHNGFSFNMQARHTFKFICNNIPDATALFVIRNKKYGCEKLEINVTEDGFEHLITGYFYEMIS